MSSAAIPPGSRRRAVAARQGRPAPLPGGLAHSRRMVRQRGGVAALGIAVALFLIGRIAGWILGGSAGAVVSFVAMIMSVPAMPVLGMPAAGGQGRLLIAIVLSAAVWWFLGQLSAGRVSRRPVVGWREWVREFLVVGVGVWVGAAGGVLLAAVLLGAL